jgi:hypothetical protein
MHPFFNSYEIFIKRKGLSGYCQGATNRLDPIPDLIAVAVAAVQQKQTEAD